MQSKSTKHIDTPCSTQNTIHNVLCTLETIRYEEKQSQVYKTEVEVVVEFEMEIR